VLAQVRAGLPGQSIGGRIRRFGHAGGSVWNEAPYANKPAGPWARRRRGSPNAHAALRVPRAAPARGGCVAVTLGERAEAFVAARGDELAGRRAAALLGRVPAAEVSDALADGLAEADADALERVLGICDELGALASPCAEKACVRLTELQRADGGWIGPEGGEDAVVRSTGMLAGYLAKTRFARPATLEAAGDRLAALFSPDRVRGAFESLAAFAHFFANADHEQSDPVLQWCGRELERGFRRGDFGALQAARVFALCHAHALPGARLTRVELLEALAAAQAPDGGFEPTPRGGADDAPRVEATLQALAALARLGGPPC